MSIEKKKKLGDILEQRIREEEENKILKLRREAEENSEKEVKNLNTLLIFVENIKNSIEEDITNGKSIRKIIIGNNGTKAHNKEVESILDLRGSLKDFSKHSKYGPVFEDLFKWAREENLNLKFDLKHDGEGMNSWYELVVDPLVLQNKPTSRKKY